MPPSPDERRFFVRLLAATGTPYSPYHRLGALERIALQALQSARVQVLVIDEVHQLLAGTHREQRLALNLIKSIANELRISIVAVGTADARHAIDSDDQMRRRFDPFALPRWNESEEFREFVSAFGKLYPLRKPSNLAEREIVQSVLRYSEGITGQVTRLLSLAAVESIRGGDEQINLAGIERVARRFREEAA
jgi:type II secretory pathway predicted ATPase ExeA